MPAITAQRGLDSEPRHPRLPLNQPHEEVKDMNNIEFRSLVVPTRLDTPDAADFVAMVSGADETNGARATPSRAKS